MRQKADSRNWVPDVVVYHGDCQDGFTAAWAVYRRYGRDPEFFAAKHGQPPPPAEMIGGKDVLFVDFTYKAPMMIALAALAKSIVILDHHKSAAEDLASFAQFEVGDKSSFVAAFDRELSRSSRLGEVILAGFDMNRSGAMLTWDFLFPDTDAPLLVSIVQDRDLWRFELSHTKQISMWLFSFDYDFNTWDWAANYLESPPNKTIAINCGEAIERKHLKDIGELLKSTAFKAQFDGHEVWCANMPYTMASDAANILAQRDPSMFGATYYFDGDGTAHFSLRSIKGEGMDVSAIAKKYGGGGHANASGFEYKTEVYPITL